MRRSFFMPFMPAMLLACSAGREAQAQTRPQPNPSVANTTSACNPSPVQPQPGCSANFDGLSDHYPTLAGAPAPHIDTPVTVPPASNVSLVPFSALLYDGQPSRTQIVCHLQIWWGSPLHSGNPMDQSDPAVVERQAQNAMDRGCDEVTFDWYGSGYAGRHLQHADAAFLDKVVQAWQRNLDARCEAANGICPLRFALMEDVGTETGRGRLGSFETDLRYAQAHYFAGHPSYWAVSAGGCAARPVVLAFGWGWPDSGSVSWRALKDWVHSGAGLDKRCQGEPLLVINGVEGLRFHNTDGSYNWVGITPYFDDRPGAIAVPGVSGTGQFDTHFEAGSGYSEADWYRAAAASDKPINIGSVYPGFNNTNTSYGFNPAAGHPFGWVTSRQCGLVWVNAWKQPAASGFFSAQNPIGYMGIVTWNDYEEGTAIEPGIDNCIDDASITAALRGQTLTWTYRFGPGAGSPATIHHYTLWSRTGSGWTQLSDPVAGLAHVACAQAGPAQYRCQARLSEPTGRQKPGAELYLQIVGQPSIRNHLSGPVTRDVARPKP